MKNRGLYRQADGSERRNSTASMNEHLLDNQTVEGPIIRRLQTMLKNGQYHAYDTAVKGLRIQGFSHQRIQVIVSGSTYGLRLA